MPIMGAKFRRQQRVFIPQSLCYGTRLTTGEDRRIVSEASTQRKGFLLF